MNPDKQWLSLIPFDKSNWWITSKNIYLDGAIRKNTCYRAYYILADGSSFGSYFRYFFWDFDSDQRYLTSIPNGFSTNPLMTSNRATLYQT